MIKKIALAAFFLLPSLGLMAQDVKLGHVNSSEIISLMPESANIEKKLKTLQDEWQTTLKNSQSEYNQKVKDFIENQKTMSDAVKNARQAEIAEMEQRINTFNETAQADLTKKHQELFAPVLEKVKKAINDVGAEEGYTYVFEISSQVIVFQSSKSNDITPLVKKKLNITTPVP